MTVRPIIKPNQLMNLQSVMARNFDTEATITRLDYESDEKGDDADNENPTTIGTVKGWMTSSPTPEATLDGAAVVTANTFHFGCPIDTDIRPRDVLVIGGSKYRVTDTTNDETWPLELAVSLRLRE